MTVERPWFKMWDEASDDAKLESLTDSQHRVWFKLMCRANQADVRGTIDAAKMRLLAVKVARGDVEILRSTLDALVELDVLVIDGVENYRFANWDKRQAGRANEDEQRSKTARRVRLFRDEGLKQAVRERDQDRCRYCGQMVEWGDDTRRPNSGTFDHLDPEGDNELDNLVVACRSCNSSKGKIVAEEGWERANGYRASRLRPAPPLRENVTSDVTSRVTSGPAPVTSDVTSGLVTKQAVTSIEERRGEREKSTPPTPPAQLNGGRSRGWDWTDDFRAFFNAYPPGHKNRSAVDAAWVAWRELPPGERDVGCVLKGLDWWKNTKSWREDDGRYIKPIDEFVMQSMWQKTDRQRPRAVVGV